MTLQNDRLLLEEAHRRVAERLHEAELDLYGRRPLPVRRLITAATLGLVLVLAALSTWALLPF
jgi:hypothetical protein